MSTSLHESPDLSMLRTVSAVSAAPASLIDAWYDASPVATMIVDAAGRIIAANAALAALLRADAAALLGTDAMRWYTPGDRQRLQAACGLAALSLPQVSDSLPACVELAGLQLVRDDGTTLRHRRIDRPMRGAQGTSYRIIALIDESGTTGTTETTASTASTASADRPVADSATAPASATATTTTQGTTSATTPVTASAGSQAAAATAMSAALLACPVPMAILDRQLTVAAVNHAFSELSGYAAGEVIGRWPAFLDADGRSGQSASVRGPLLRVRFEAMLDDPGARDEVRSVLTTRSGQRLSIRLQSCRLVDADDAAGQAFVLALLEAPSALGPTRSGARTFAATPRVPPLSAAQQPQRAHSPDPLRRSIDERGDMLVLLGPTIEEGAPTARLRVLDCNAQVDALMGVDRQAALNASGALLTHLSPADRQRFLTALRRARGAVGAGAGPAAGAHGPSELELTVNHPRRGDRLIRLRLLAAREDSQQTLLIGEDISERRQHGRQAEAIVSPQRDVLVREVHHRIKNNLQGVAGLLRQVADRHPALASSLDDIAGQVQAIAQVHGLHVHDDGLPSLEPMIESVFSNLARNFGVPIAIESPPRGAGSDWRLPESEAVPIALIINELGTNAIKHNRPDGRVAVRWQSDDSAVMIDVSNQGALPKEFDFGRLAGGASGLGLVKAMLPRRGAELTIDRQGDRVLARLSLRRPVLIRADGTDRAEAHP